MRIARFALATFAISFLVRPLGGLFWGPLGDRIGRKSVLAMTILMMDTFNKSMPIVYNTTQHYRNDRLPFLQALNKSIEQNKRYSVLIVELLGKLVQRKNISLE